jgi:hypothetical protein
VDGIDQLIAEEVRSVERKKGGRSARLVILVLLCLIVAGYSSYYFKFSASQQPDSAVSDNAQRYPMPEHMQGVAAPEEPQVALLPLLPQQPQQPQQPAVQPAAVAAVAPENLSQPAKIDYRVVSGPFISSAELNRAELLIKRQGWDYEKEVGVGAVEMIRLLDGSYPVDVAHTRLRELQLRYKSAFALASADGLDVYLASFHSSDRAAKMVEELQRDGYSVRPVRRMVQLMRSQLLSEYMTADNADRLLELLQSEGINAEIAEKR